MSITRLLVVALFLVGGCSSEHAARPTHAHARARTSGSSAAHEHAAHPASSAHASEHASAAAEEEHADAPPAPTAMDQSEAPSDVEITRSIRSAVVQDGSLSFTARNVVIITQASVVTLRGNVTHEERRAIHAHAFAAVGVTRIDDQLIVDP